MHLMHNATAPPPPARRPRRPRGRARSPPRRPGRPSRRPPRAPTSPRRPPSQPPPRAGARPPAWQCSARTPAAASHCARRHARVSLRRRQCIGPCNRGLPSIVATVLLMCKPASIVEADQSSHCYAVEWPASRCRRDQRGLSCVAAQRAASKLVPYCSRTRCCRPLAVAPEHRMLRALVTSPHGCWCSEQCVANFYARSASCTAALCKQRVQCSSWVPTAARAPSRSARPRRKRRRRGRRRSRTS